MSKTNVINSFPGYTYIPYGEDKQSHNMYMGEDVGFGGYVYVEPGCYTNVALLDIASQHPHSLIAMNCLGEYTERFKELVDLRIAIKHKDWDKARTMLDGAAAEFLEDEGKAKLLSNALKIPINSVYGLTSAKFPNAFRDPRNVNNIVALRGALFMVTLKHEIIKRGYKPFHFKTDSVKIADADEKIISFCIEFARKYGYEFEHEATYEKICIVNGSTYIAKYSQDKVNGDHVGTWTATAAQFQQPYVFKTLFSHEEITFKDMCEVKEVKGALYLDLNEGLPDVSEFESLKDARNKQFEDKKLTKREELLISEYEDLSDKQVQNRIDKGHNYHFVGKVGEFCPMIQGSGGGELLRFDNGKYSAVTGTKGYRWMESENVRQLGLFDSIDKSYYTKLVDDAVKDISQYTDFEWFVS